MTIILVTLDWEHAMAKTLPLSEVKTRLPELVAGVDEREEEVVVTKNGRPAAVLVNVQEYARLKETLDVLSDPDLMTQVAESRAFYKTGKRGLSFEDVFGEPTAPIKKRRSA
jgi:antitoxin YefM